MKSLFRNKITRRGFVAGSTGMAIAATAGCAQQQQQQQQAASAGTKLAIVHTNDSHGHDVRDSESLGLAAAVQLKADYEAKGYEVLLLDAGDVVQGNNLVNHSRGDVGIDFLNECGYMAMALGNHEFDYGQDEIAKYVSAANFPLLSANVIVDATGDTLVEPNTVLTLANGTKIGVFGLTTPETQTKTFPFLINGLSFLADEKLYACAQEQADTLRAKGCSLVVCLAHLGEFDDAAPNRAQDVVANTHGIDLVIDGHDHKVENQQVKNAKGEDVLVVEADCYTHAVGVVTWEDGKLSETLMEFGSYDGEDAKVAAGIQAVADEVDSKLQEVVGSVSFDLDGERSDVRTRETNLGDFICDAILWEAQQMADDMPDGAILNGGGIRQSIKAGDITEGDILDVLPFINHICTVQVTGSQLLEALEAGCSMAPDELGGFPQVSNMSFSVDTSVAYEMGDQYPKSTYHAPAKPGSRVTIHKVGDRDFVADDVYTVASIDFVCAGGDTYYVFAEAAQKTMRSINYLISDTTKYYLQEAHGSVVPDEYADPAGQGRIEIK